MLRQHCVTLWERGFCCDWNPACPLAEQPSSIIHSHCLSGLLLQRGHFFLNFLNTFVILTQICNRAILRDVLEKDYHYRQQTKFAKVMFSQVSVCPQGSPGLSGGSPSRKGLCQGDPLDRLPRTDPPGQGPPGQRPLWTEAPSGQIPFPWTETLPLDRDPPGQTATGQRYP